MYNFHFACAYLTHSILVTPKYTLWQTVKIRMKCCIMRHFIRVYTVCQAKNSLQRKKYNFYLEIIACDPMIYTMDHPKFIVLYQKEESISAKRVFVYVFLSCVCYAFVRVCLLCALWSPAGKGLTSWLLFVVSNCEFVTFPLVSLVRYGT